VGGFRFLGGRGGKTENPGNIFLFLDVGRKSRGARYNRGKVWVRPQEDGERGRIIF